jgi:hypothetical protein
MDPFLRSTVWKCVTILTGASLAWARVLPCNEDRAQTLNRLNLRSSTGRQESGVHERTRILHDIWCAYLVLLFSARPIPFSTPFNGATREKSRLVMPGTFRHWFIGATLNKMGRPSQRIPPGFVGPVPKRGQDSGLLVTRIR